MATQAVEVPLKKRSALRDRFDLGSGFTPYFLVLPTVFAILAVAAYPILNSLWLSLLDNPLSPSAQFTGLSNYVLLFKSHDLVRASILVPWAFPTVVSAQIWYLMYNDRTGIVSYILQQMHFLAPGDTLLRSPSGIIAAAIITDVWKTTPFMALLILAGLQVIPTELYEAAGVDGSTRWQQFWTITLPLVSESLVIALLFRTLAALGVFDLLYILGGNQVQSIASFSYNNMFTRSSFDFAPGVAAAAVLFVMGLILSLLYLLAIRFTRR
ncbi:MAG: sugar ABC transporter permease [Ktedonobacteraceae bacterium]